MLPLPKPSNRTARSIEPCCLPLTRIRIRGAPNRPCSSTSHPRRLSSAFRAAAMQVACAIWLPVTRAKLACGGICSNCFSQSPTTSSTMAAAGDPQYRAAFWFQVEVSQSAATAEGRAPPTTQAKKRPLADPWIPPFVSQVSSSITCSDRMPVSGRALASALRSSDAVLAAPTGAVSI